MTWLSWLSHCIIFQIRKKKKNCELSDMLHGVCFLLFITNQKIMLSSSRGQDIFEDFRLRGQCQGTDLKMCPRGRPRGQGRPRGLHL